MEPAMEHETPRGQAVRSITTEFESPDTPRMKAALAIQSDRKGEKRLQQKLVTLTFEGIIILYTHDYDTFR